MPYGFEPIQNTDCTVLILGTMPGQASLAAGQYYAHRQNHFWRIMFRLLENAEPLSDYEARKRLLLSHNIALWDVLYSCEREGSSDGNIRQPAANDFASFFDSHPKIRSICFNGGGAERLFRRFVLPNIGKTELKFIPLPSTSPANTMRYEQKLLLWHDGLTMAGVKIRSGLF